MNRYGFKKKRAQLCASALVISILLMPMQAAGVVSATASEPMVVNGNITPIPAKKPEYTKTPSISDMNGTMFKSMSLNLAGFLSVDSVDTKSYPYGYKPLSAVQSKLYARIFKAQALGNMGEADELLTDIQDKSLIGHALSQRYLHSSYKSSFSELQDWMEKYSDHPAAKRVYKLAVSKRGDVAVNKISKPTNGRMLSQVNEPTIYYPLIYKSKLVRSSGEKKSITALKKQTSLFLRKRNPLGALKNFRDSDARDLLDMTEHDIIQSDIAAGFLYKGHLESAYKLASKSSDRSGAAIPESSWIAGLALWQQEDFAKAAQYFEKAGDSKYSSGWLSSAGYYWASRSYKRTNNNKKYSGSLKNAAKHSRTFYGLMAAHALGRDFNFNWDIAEYQDSHEELILSKEAGQRAYGLVAAGQYDLAASELLRLDYKGNKPLRMAALAYASHVGLPSVSLRLGNMVKREKGKYYDSALYPVSPWAPKDGYKLDPALVHAVIRQESRFDLQAKSYSGAIGLMQVMPKTADYVAKTNKYEEKLSASKLRLPEMNMKVGQDYIEYLLKGRYVKGDMVSLLVSYNAGPGNMLKWRGRMAANEDRLLFIETLPVQETRDYVERVLSNYWIYRDRAGLDLPSLVALSNGKSPQYAHIMQADYPYKLAANQ